MSRCWICLDSLESTFAERVCCPWTTRPRYEYGITLGGDHKVIEICAHCKEQVGTSYFAEKARVLMKRDK
jgi:hypothetical protein